MKAKDLGPRKGVGATQIMEVIFDGRYTTIPSQDDVR